MFDERKHKRAPKGSSNGGQFTSSDGAGGIHEATEAEKRRLSEMGITVGGTKKMTPAEKIASVHIDFDRDNELPELNEDTLDKLGETSNKPVLLKAKSIKRNLGKHIDVNEKVMQDIITEALYNPMASFVEIQGKDGLKMGLVLLDVDKNKKCFEIGHAYFVDGEGFKRANNKTQKKD